MTDFINPEMTEIAALLKQVKRIAVVGLSPKAKRPSHQVAVSLQQFGYQVVPVRPAVDEVLGETAYPSLDEVPGAIDLVDVFRAPEHVMPIVEKCIELKVPAIWLQDGVVNQEAAQRAVEAGITVVMDRCIYRDYLTLFPDE